MKKLSVVILARNEEQNISGCIKSVAFSDEIIVIDDNSTDKTREIALSLGARIYTRTLDDFARQRNFGLEKASCSWVLFIDADERVPSSLASEILSVV